MGRLFVRKLEDPGPILHCKHCRTPFCRRDDLLSTNFRGRTGPAWLVDRVINVNLGEAEDSVMTTGPHRIRAAFCVKCQENVGWCYEKAYVEDQKYKEGRFILEEELIVESQPLRLSEEEQELLIYSGTGRGGGSYRGRCSGAAGRSSGRGKRITSKWSTTPSTSTGARSLMSTTASSSSSAPPPAGSSAGEEEVCRITMDHDGREKTTSRESAQSGSGAHDFRLVPGGTERDDHGEESPDRAPSLESVNGSDEELSLLE